MSSSADGAGPKGERVLIETVDQWADWLEANHDRDSGIWLVYWKRTTGKPSIGYEDAVIEALRFGWVDSKGSRLDDDRSMLWFSPRRRGSGWARPNKVRIDMLEREGRMAPAGRRVVEAAKADGTWQLLDAVEDLIIPDDLMAAFAANPGSSAYWEAFPRSVKRSILEWIVRAKKEETRSRRVNETATMAARGERAHQGKSPSGSS
ncbi:MAG: YdeI/OmpD-associated family protein [Acidimicrobiia bacterium]